MPVIQRKHFDPLRILPVPLVHTQTHGHKGEQVPVSEVEAQGEIYPVLAHSMYYFKQGTGCSMDLQILVHSSLEGGLRKLPAQP